MVNISITSNNNKPRQRGKFTCHYADGRKSTTYATFPQVKFAALKYLKANASCAYARIVYTPTGVTIGHVTQSNVDEFDDWGLQ